MVDYSGRLKEAMGGVISVRALATGVGVSYQAVKKVLDGTSRAFSAEDNSKVASFLSVDPTWLATGQGAMRAPLPVQEMRPLYGTEISSLEVPILSATGSMGPGDDQHAEDFVVGRLSLSPSWVTKQIKPLSSPSNLRFIHAYGDSMEPTFSDGDVLLVDGGIRQVSVDGIFVLEAQSRLFIKRVRQRMDGAFEISSDNANVKTVDVLNGDHAVAVLGRVLWAWNGRKL